MIVNVILIIISLPFYFFTFLPLKRHLHLCLKPIIIIRTDVLANKTAGILHLHTAFLIEPVLKTDGKVSLIPAINLRITVESLTTGYDIECIDYRNAEGGM